MSSTEFVFVIAATPESSARAVASLADAGYVTASPADYRTLGGMYAALGSADGVVAVDGWESSPGARVDVEFAAALGKPFLTLPELLPAAA